MSYILDALKRAERERSSTASEQTATATATPRRTLRPTTMALAGATLFLAGIGAAALLLRPAPPAAPDAPADIVERIEPERRIEATPPPAAPVASQTVLPDVSELADYESLDDVAPVFQGSPTTPATVATATPGAPSTPDTPVSPAPAGDAASADAPQQRAEAAASEATERQLPPRLAEMPDAYQSRFPSPVIQVHVFDSEPSRRWIMVDNRRQGEGGALDSGLLVTEILDKGVIFEFGGSRVYWPLNR